MAKRQKYIERLVFEFCPILGTVFYLKKYKVFSKGNNYHK